MIQTGPPFAIVSVCNGGGYRYCRTDPPHPKRNAKGLYTLHRVLLENKLGRLLRHDEHAHHDDGDKSNDDPKNIRLMTRADHGREHAKDLYVPDVSCLCPVCEATFFVMARELRWRTKRNQLGEIYCSRSCGRRAVDLR